MTHLSRDLLEANLEIIKVLGSAIAKRDSDTDLHNYRVAIYSVRLAERIGLDAASVRSLIKGAFLHDVGKIGIRDDILLKPGKLTEPEFDVMKQHVRHGLDIVSRSDWLSDGANVVGHHHEKYDGSGYPDALRGKDIPVSARIFAIADVFDALTSKRPYKEPFSFERALDILTEGRGTHFDAALLDEFGCIAADLYREYSGRDDDRPRQALAEIVEEYFKSDSVLLAQMREGK
jgi:HD-GYP domain-containing protein (c-di-GMP phosphodiesterase class II)